MEAQKQVSTWVVVGLAVAVVVALVAIVALVLGRTGFVAGGRNYPTNQLSVTGSGDAYGKPDVAYVDLGIDVANANVSAALNQANQTMGSVQEAVKGAGVAEEDVQTTSFNVYPEDRYDPQTNQPTGERIYHAQNVLRITVRDVSKVGAVIDAGTKAGANTVQNVSFSILDTEALAAEARTKAVADAKKRAQQLADDLGVKLGSATVVSESYGSIPVYQPSFAAQDAVGRGGAAAPVSSGQLAVSVQVNVTFTLTP